MDPACTAAAAATSSNGGDTCIALRRTPRTCTMNNNSNNNNNKNHSTRRTSSAAKAAAQAPTATATGAQPGSTREQQNQHRYHQQEQEQCGNDVTATNDTIVTKTPGKPKPRKRVRFSDPGPQLVVDGQQDEDEDQQDEDEDQIRTSSSCNSTPRHPPSSASTGLTPMIRRSSLGNRNTSPATGNATASPSAKRRRRRHSAPNTAAAVSSPCHHEDSGDNNNNSSSSSSSSNSGGGGSGGIYFPSLRQILSDRVKRRIRRNGLSEEMNSISAEKRQRQREQEAEVRRLRDCLAAKDAEIERLREDSSSIMLPGVEEAGDDQEESSTTRLPALSQRGGGQTGDDTREIDDGCHNDDDDDDDDDDVTRKLEELEREVETLRRELDSRSTPSPPLPSLPPASSSGVTTSLPSPSPVPNLKREDDREQREETHVEASRFYDWTISARDPFRSDEYSDVIGMDIDQDEEEEEDDDDQMMDNFNDDDDDGYYDDGFTRLEDSTFGDSTMLDLVCSTPSRRQRHRSSFDNNRNRSHDHGNDADPARTTTTTTTANTTARDAGSSFPTPPCTSPTIPATPCSERVLDKMTLMPLDSITPRSSARPTRREVLQLSSASVQVSLPNPEAEAAKAELESLRLELGKITETLEARASLQARLSRKVSTGLSASSLKRDDNDGSNSSSSSSSSSSDVAEVLSYKGGNDTTRDDNNEDIEAQLDQLLQLLSDRTAALQHLGASLGALGFPGADASDVVTSLTSSLRAARLELEYLTPGEIPLPLTSRGAEVLDLVLQRLRDLSRREHEHEQAIDEYHALELSLRQQLSARVDVADKLRGQLGERDERISDLEVGIDRLKGAAEGYRRDIAELEGLVQRLEEDMLAAADAAEVDKKQQQEEHVEELLQARRDAAAEAARETDATGQEARMQIQNELDATKQELGTCNSALSEFEHKLASVLEQTELFEKELSAVQLAKDKEIRALNQAHGRHLALRDARVVELRGEIDSINGSLRKAHGTIQKLRLDKLKLGRELEQERARAKVAVDEMKAELQRVAEMSRGFMAPTPKRKGSRKRTSAAAAEDYAGDVGASTAAATPSRKSRRLSRLSSISTASSIAAAEESTLTADSVVGGKGLLKKKARRKYDSGIGLNDDEELDELVM